MHYTSIDKRMLCDDLLEVMVVMGFRRGKEGEMVPTMRDSCVQDSKGIPEPSNRHVRAHNKRAKINWS